MIPEEAFRFGEAAIRRGWCSLTDIVEGLSHVRIALSRGEIPPSLEDLLVARGVLTEERAASLKTELRLESTGELVAGYRILGPIGSGGVGTVYKAQHVHMDRPGARTRLPVAATARAGDGERFLREARAVARLQHPHIVRGFDAGEHGGVRYLAMELLDGETALQVLRRIGPFPERRALILVRAVAAALDHAWSHGVIHRDVKPSNIFMTTDGRTVLFDFGLAKKVVDDPFSSVGVVAMVTPHYASPEQIRRLPDIDIRTDLYSLGCAWYHLLTGRPPYTGSSSADIAAKHLKDPFPPLEANPAPDGTREKTDSLRAAEVIIRRLCAKNRDARYPDPRSLLPDLDELAQAFERDGGGATGRFARALMEKLVRRSPEPQAQGQGQAQGGVADLLARIEELQEENARLFCERDLLRHEAGKDEKSIEHLEAENARLACSRDLLLVEVQALRAAMDGLRLRRDAQRRARAARGSGDGPE